MMRWLAVVVAVMLGAVACEKQTPCHDIEVVEGCKARCKEVKTDPSGAVTLCSELLQITRTGQNNILQTQNKKVSTRKLPQAVCFPVQDNHVADAALQTQLKAQCEEGGAQP